ncbi:fumarylacetoacetate hydrolase family protein [Alteromonas pelagimontana]|uniref:Fumarylacetoacetate hydrolase family protein n=1 Tax=Alteromonas pelagimontana TaxID=1858656 RepID=A0A6M4MG90_9ALTE|nr:fumarylacetoacetate hydrolase family protein [Alteromonas pelagimontana]QJR82204.1 fumarylacetoacetate hydrolase family protein [Alteromonas pelagimontana]
MYQHLDSLGLPVDLPLGKVVCVGRNYLDHVQEMQSEVPAEPLLFMKPVNALCHLSQPLSIPADKGECHNELEIAVLLKQRLCHATHDDVEAAIWGVGLALDLTLRDVQRTLKAQGHPWERAKAFDFSCPVSGFVPISQVPDLQNIEFTLTVNGEARQAGNSNMMLRGIVDLISHMSSVFTLDAGDIILTGTPKGVGPLTSEDSVSATLADKITVETSVQAL